MGTTDLSELKSADNKQVLRKQMNKPEKRLGRKPKQPEERQTEKVTINFTIVEKEKLLALSQEKGNLPLTILIRNILKEYGAI
jgi:hypothetical protein